MLSWQEAQGSTATDADSADLTGEDWEEWEGRKRKNGRVVSRLESDPGRARSWLKRDPSKCKTRLLQPSMLQSARARSQSSCTFRR